MSAEGEGDAGKRRGLVLGAGGVLGFAWMIGALSALEQEEGFDARSVEMCVGTSAGSVLAALLGWPQGTFASKIDVSGDSVAVTREVDGGLETLKLVTPAIVTTDLRLNEPRYASLPNIMKAKSKPMAVKSPGDFGVDVAARLETLKVVEPSKRQAGIKVASVDELVERLKGLGVAK